MKKLIFTMFVFLIANNVCFAGTATIFSNANAANLRDKIIKLYALEGAQIENYVTNTNSFSISKNKLSSIYNIRLNYNYTIVQDGKNSIVSLAMSTGIGAYQDSATLSSQEQQELDRVKGKISGYYSYGLAYSEKIYFYNEYNENGVLIQQNVIAPAQRILGVKLTAVNYDAKKKGLYIGDRIKKVNGKKISKYSRPDLAKIFKPTSQNDIIEITYKRKGEIKTVKLYPTFIKADERL